MLLTPWFPQIWVNAQDQKENEEIKKERKGSNYTRVRTQLVKYPSILSKTPKKLILIFTCFFK